MLLIPLFLYLFFFFIAKPIPHLKFFVPSYICLIEFVKFYPYYYQDHIKNFLIEFMHIVLHDSTIWTH